jgi:hypothetical protein
MDLNNSINLNMIDRNESNLDSNKTTITTSIVYKKLNGRVVDGEISGATVFFDINRNGLLDENEPYTKSNKRGFFSLEINESEAKDYSIPLVAFGGKDVRLNREFEEILMAFRDKNSTNVNITPITTLIANNMLSNIDNGNLKSKSKLQKITSDELFKLLYESKRKFGELFDLKEEILMADPIELALKGNLSLLETNMKVNRVAKELKKAVKKNLINKRIEALNSYRALSRALIKAQEEAKKGDVALVDAINYVSKIAPEVFDKNLIENVRAVTKFALEEFNKNWEKSKKDIVSALKEEREFVILQETEKNIEDQIAQYDNNGDGLPDNPEDIISLQDRVDTTDSVVNTNTTNNTDTTDPVVNTNTTNNTDTTDPVVNTNTTNNTDTTDPVINTNTTNNTDTTDPVVNTNTTNNTDTTDPVVNTNTTNNTDTTDPVVNTNTINDTNTTDMNTTIELDTNSSLVSLKVAEPFFMEYNQSGKYTLQNAPKGMRIIDSGYLTWTPSKLQTGDYNITLLKDGIEFDKINIRVEDNSSFETNGYFLDLSLNSSSDANGSEEAPFSNMEKACSVAKAGDTIYIRGGIYKSSNYLDGNLDKLAFVKVVGCNGEEGKNITIRPWGNEQVKILTDGYLGISIFGSSYVTLDGFEVEGVARKISLEEAAKNWWTDYKYYNGGGISVTNSATAITHDITIKNCIVHDVPAAGIHSYGPTHINIEDNIVYNTNWWTTKGTTGIGIVLATDLDGDDENTTYNKIQGNLIFNTEQRIFSRVWNKSGANIVIDEGEGILVQEGMLTTTDEDGSERTGYYGRYLVQNNILAYNSSGIVANLADRVDIFNNTLYNNGVIAISPYNNRAIGGISLNTSDDTVLVKNLVQATPNTTVYWLNRDSTNIQKSDNHMSGYFLNYDFVNYDGIVKHSVDEPLLKNPEVGDFSPIDELSGIGSNTDIITKAKKLGIEILPTNFDVNKSELLKLILDNIPSDVNMTGYEEDDRNGYLHIRFPDDHSHTIITGDNNYTLEIPLVYLEDFNLTQEYNITQKIEPIVDTNSVIEYKSSGKNMLTNGSFELGIGTEPYYIGWSPENARAGMNEPPLPIIDETTAMYGKKSIKFTLPNKDNYFIIDFKPPYIADSGDYKIYMGVSAKTDCPDEIMLNLYTNADARIQSDEWKRYRFNVQTSKPAYPIYKFRLINLTEDNRSCNIWLDGFTWSLEEADTENFVRSDVVEAVFVSKPNRISMHFDSDDVILEANIDSNESIDTVAELHIRDLTRDGLDKVYAQKDLNLSEGIVSSLNFNLGKMKHGAYMAHLVILDKNSSKILGEAREKFSVMSDLTKIKPPVDFVVGIHGGLNTFSENRTFDYRGYWSVDEYYKEAYQIGIRAQRIIVGIPQIMPEGEIDFSLEAPAIDSASENNCTTVLALNPFLDVEKDYEPTGDNAGDWVVTDENKLVDGVNDYKDLYRLPEDKLVDLYKYVANRFNGKLLAIENENELNMFYTSDGMGYAVRDLFEPIYEPFKEIAPDIPILVDITMDFYGGDFTKHFFENDGAKYSDGVTYHPYGREWIYVKTSNGDEHYGINFIKRNEDYINADYNVSKELIMGMSEIHEIGTLSSVGWDAMQRILLDWSGGAKFSAGILGEGLYFLEARDKNEWQEKSPHAPGIGAVAINGMYSVLGGYRLLKRIDLEETNSKILVVAFENNESDYKYAIAVAQGDVPDQIATLNVTLPADTIFFDQWGEKLDSVATPLKLSNEILYIKSNSYDLIQAFEDINATDDLIWIDEPNGYNYTPELLDFTVRPDPTWYHELLNSGIRPRTKRE